MAPAAQISGADHVPVLLGPVCDALTPLADRVVIDGTFGAGGYSRAFLAAGARVLAIDRDPTALAAAAEWAGDEPQLSLHRGEFADLAEIARDAGFETVDAVVLDIGVSSMQLDQAMRGFSFMRDGPLDMRMSDEGTSAADLVNDLDEGVLADLIHALGEDRAARRIAKAIVNARRNQEITRTLELADIVSSVLPRPRPGQMHPATRTFQALRIAVNDELGQLVAALTGAEEILAPGGVLAVVSFHSLEDRIVKRFFQAASSSGEGGSRHAPAIQRPPARFERPAKPVAANEAEIAANPRARSARLRWAVRTDAPAVKPDARALGMPRMPNLQQEARR